MKWIRKEIHICDSATMFDNQEEEIYRRMLNELIYAIPSELLKKKFKLDIINPFDGNYEKTMTAMGTTNYLRSKLSNLRRNREIEYTITYDL